MRKTFITNDINEKWNFICEVSIALHLLFLQTNNTKHQNNQKGIHDRQYLIFKICQMISVLLSLTHFHLS